MELEQIFDSMENKDKDIRDSFRFSIREGIYVTSNEAKSIKTEEIPEKVMSYFRKRKIAADGEMRYDSFKDSMKNRLNPESIEETFFGMYVLTNGKFVPREVPIKLIKPFSENDGWGKWATLYLFNGVYAYHSSKKFQYSENTVYGNVRTLIMNGIENIKIRNRKYQKGLFLPFENNIKSYLHLPTTQMKKYVSDPLPDTNTNPDFNKTKSYELGSDFNLGSGTGGISRTGQGPSSGCLF